MEEMMQTDKIAEALAKAQAEMHNAPMNKLNPHFKSKYADLASIRDAVVPHLAKHGIALTQPTEMRDGALVLITKLVHASGQCIASEWPIVLDTPQKMAAQMTYGKRIGITAVCGIAGDDDDDGNVAETTGKPTPEQVVAKQRARKEAAEAEKPPWRGPQPVTELKTNLNALIAAVAECQTEKEVEGLWFGDEYKPTLDQAQHDLPKWYKRAEDVVNETLNKMLESAQ